jgi:hypothetical protein
MNGEWCTRGIPASPSRTSTCDVCESSVPMSHASLAIQKSIYRLSRPRLHEAIARLYLYNGVNDSVSKLEATAYVVQRHSLA